MSEHNKVKVLIFPAGSESALDSFEALRYNVNVEVFGASGKSDDAEFSYDAEHYISGDFYITNDDFFDKFNEILDSRSIDIVIPTHDTIALFFAENRDKFHAKILVSDAETALVCRYKSKTYDTFSDCGFCPKYYRDTENVPDNAFPLFAKPDVGAGAKGAAVIHNAQELADYDPKKYVICEMLPGDEYTVDCFTSAEGTLKYCGMRTRERIQMGIAFRSRTLDLPDEVKEIAETINSRLSFLGVWYFQIKKTEDGRFKLMEISCRQPGTITVNRHKGVNFPLLGIYELIGKGSRVMPGNYNVVMDRYLKACFRLDISYDTVYIDFDDTITDNGKLNILVMSFIFQCLNDKKRLILLTKHKNEIYDTLREYKLSETIFDEIIHIEPTQKKTDYITHKNAIFIDNSFAERADVYEKCGIPVFDVDTVDALMKK